jgi:hypothetical protein
MLKHRLEEVQGFGVVVWQQVQRAFDAPGQVAIRAGTKGESGRGRGGLGVGTNEGGEFDQTVDGGGPIFGVAGQSCGPKGPLKRKNVRATQVGGADVRK